MASLYRISIILIVTLMLTGCVGNNYPENVNSTLKAAGDNRGELEQVIEHYQTYGDSLRLEAAYFLIGNMEEHCYVTYRLFDTSDVTVEFDPMSFPDYKSLLVAVDSIEKARGELDYGRLDKVLDIETIKADFLINHIDLAFRAWHDKPWARNLTFTNFCRYVLPYRGSNEPLEDWRSYFLEKYKTIDAEIDDVKDPIQVASAINNDVRAWFGFDERYYFHPTDQGLSEMIDSKLGRCEDMTNITIFALRANGLAVTSDYTPHWANTGNNHAWNAILAEDGSVIPFMGAEANPGDYRLHNKAAKVYRKMYDKQMDNLVFQPRRQDKMPRWLGGKYYIDVTADYMDVTDVVIDFAEPIADSIDITYICVFNSGKFSPIHWGRVVDGKTTFTDIGKGILYLVATYENEAIVPVTEPFVLTEDGTVEYKIINSEILTSVTIENVPIRAQAASSETVQRTPLAADVPYELKYWKDNAWQVYGEYTPQSKKIVVTDLPEGGLYWLVAKESSNDERIFTIEDNRQIFW